MKSKSPGSCLLFAFLLCGCLYSCLRDESFSASEKEERFFEADGADEWLQPVVRLLKQKNDSTGFAESFVERYGYPLWRDAYKFPENGGMAFAVPVRSTVPDTEIEAIWFFSLTAGHTKYRIYTRRMADRILSETCGEGIEEIWMFDYFTRSVLHREPGSGLSFREDSASAGTRSTILVDETQCVEAYAGYDGVEEYKGTHCWTTTTAYFINEIAAPDEKIAGNGDFDMEPGGGGGGGGRSKTPAEVAPKASSIFRNSNMTEPNWRILENMLDKIIKDCLGGELYNGLKSFLNGKTLTIQFKLGSGGKFGMQGKSVGISLGMQMESNQLLHEIFHAYQAYRSVPESYNKSLMNNEIEAHYAQYLYTSRLPEYKGSKWEERDEDDARRKSIKKLTGYLDMKGNLLPGITDAMLDIEIMNGAIPALRAAGYTEDRYPLNDDITGVANFENLKKLTVKCK